MFSISNPFNKTFLAKYQYSSDIEANLLLNISQKTLDNWKVLTLDERIKFIKNLIFTLTKKQHFLAQNSTLEMGKPISQSLAEVKKCASLCDFYLKNAQDFLNSDIIKTDGAESFVVYEPLGVILGVMPWNFPYWQVFRFAIPAILAGNTVVVKHASNVAGSAKLLEELFFGSRLP